MTAPTRAAADTAADPYFYGWRYVRRTLPGGTVMTEQVPLTAEDVLHPEEEDFIVQTSEHQSLVNYFSGVFGAILAHTPTAQVLSDCRIAWGVPGLGAHGPDIAVFLGVRERKNWATFDVAAEGARSLLVLEVTSPSTASGDFEDKVVDYHRAGVPLYIIVDLLPLDRQQPPRLLGYTWAPGGYQPLAPDERGWLWLAPLRLWLGVAGNLVRCFTEAGELLRPHPDEYAARVAAEARAMAEAAARAEAEARNRELEAEIRRLRGDA